MDEPPQAFRAPMRARDRDIDPFEGARFGVDNGLVGTGDHLDFPPSNIEDAILAAASEHGDRAGRNLLRYSRAPIGVFVWTRTGDDEYRFGRIIGDWRYEKTKAASAVGIHHVRDAFWVPNAFSGAQAPTAIAKTFARGGHNFQRINDRPAELETRRLWNQVG